jgi:phosphate transport system ATP-binding protein
MDEPTAYLDPVSTSIILDLINSFKKYYTIIVVSHNVQQSGRISDYSGFFLDGELIEFDEAGNFFTRPKDKRTENFITSRY